MIRRVWRKLGSRLDLDRNWRLGMVCESLICDFFDHESLFFPLLPVSVDLMVPAAKKVHPPKYKLFGGTCYAYMVTTKKKSF
jgi:hypothetical protein